MASARLCVDDIGDLLFLVADMVPPEDDRFDSFSTFDGRSFRGPATAPSDRGTPHRTHLIERIQFSYVQLLHGHLLGSGVGRTEVATARFLSLLIALAASGELGEFFAET